MGLLGNDGAITGGDILYKNQNVTDLKGDELRRLRGPEMGMIFQNTGASLCPIRTIEDQLYEAVLQHEKTTKQEIKDRAMDLFEKMKLPDGERILKSYPFELSGGMNQRVGICAAMMMKPSLLLADEPTSALDVTVQKQVVEEMKLMRQDYGTAMILVTHNIGVVGAMADQVLVLKNGNVMEYGSTDHVLNHSENEYTRKLMDSVLHLRRG